MALEASLWPASPHLSSSQSEVERCEPVSLLFLITLIRITEALVIILTRCHSAHHCKSVGPHFPFVFHPPYTAFSPLFCPTTDSFLVFNAALLDKKAILFHTSRTLSLSLSPLLVLFFIFLRDPPSGPPPSPPAPLPYIKAVLTSESAV